MQKDRTDSLNQGNADVSIFFQSSVVDEVKLASQGSVALIRLVHADLTLMMWHSILELLPQKDA